MQAVVDATETGAEMSPLNDSKSLYALPLAGTTIIGHVLDSLAEVGVDHVALNIAGDAIKSVLGAGRGADRLERGDQTIEFVKHFQPKTKGLSADEGFLYVRADAIYDWQSVAALDEHEAAVGYIDQPNEAAQGKVTIEEGAVTDTNLDRHPVSGPMSAYAYKFPAAAHEWDYSVDPMSIELAHTHNPAAVELGGWHPVRHPHDLLTANQMAMDVFDYEDGDRHQAIVEGEVEIGQNAVVRDSILMEGATVGDNAVVKNSIIGEGATVGDGVVVNDRKADGSEIVAQWRDGKAQASGRTRLGAVVGPRTTVMSGATINNGTVIGSGSVIEPGENVR